MAPHTEEPRQGLQMWHVMSFARHGLSLLPSTAWCFGSAFFPLLAPGMRVPSLQQVCRQEMGNTLPQTQGT